MAAHKQVQYTYRTRLVHLEVDGKVVTGDSGEAMTENVEVKLSWPVATRKAATSTAALRAAARKAVQKANTGQQYPRDFLVDGVEVTGKRVFPTR